MEVLVTGGSGSIGRWTIHSLLDEGHSPVVYDVEIDQSYLNDILDDIALVEGDVTDWGHLSATLAEYDIDRIVHLAKVVGHRGQADPVFTLEVNVLGTANVLRAANENDVDRVVYSSSKSVFDDITGKHGPPTFEPIPPEYPTFDRDSTSYIPFYSVTNKMAEYFAIRYAMESDIELVITRFGNTWGPGKVGAQEKFHQDEDVTRFTGGYVVSNMIDEAIAGNEATVEEDETDDFVYTKDVARGLVAAVTSERIQFEPNHRDVLIDAGQLYSTSDFADVLNRRFPDVHIDVTDEATESKHRRNIAGVFDISRTEAETGYRPKYADLEAAIDDYVETVERYT